MVYPTHLAGGAQALLNELLNGLWITAHILNSFLKEMGKNERELGEKVRFMFENV